MTKSTPLAPGDRVRIRAEYDPPEAPARYGTVVLVGSQAVIVREPSASDPRMTSTWPYAPRELEKIEN